MDPRPMDAPAGGFRPRSRQFHPQNESRAREDELGGWFSWTAAAKPQQKIGNQRFEPKYQG
jgi:hypothetical protein